MIKEKPILGIRAEYIYSSADQPIIHNGCILWQDDVILFVGSYPPESDPYPRIEWLQQGNQLVLPGFINAHEHGRGIGSLRMGVPDDMLEIWLPQNTATPSLNLYLAALYNGLLMVSSGVTTTMHFHRNSNPETLEEEISQVIKAYREVGIRVCIGIPFRNQNSLYYGGNEAFLQSIPDQLASRVRSAGLADPPPDWRDIYAIGQHIQQSWQGQKNFWAGWAPANLHWCSDDLLMALSADESNLPIQIHLVETILQQKYGYRLYGKTPVARLDELGFLSPKVSLAHAVWLTDEDIHILADRGVSVIHNPSSNLRLRSGICRVLRLLGEGIPVGLGLDGQTLNENQDFLGEIRLARALAFNPGKVGQSLATKQVLQMATEFGAQILAGPQPARGRLEKGWAADFITIDLDSLTHPFVDDRIDPLEALVSLGKPKDVDLVVVAGEIRMSNGKHVNLDLSVVEEQIKEALDREKNQPELEMESLLAQLKPHYQNLYSSW